jgi:hypothetical protein
MLAAMAASAWAMTAGGSSWLGACSSGLFDDMMKGTSLDKQERIRGIVITVYCSKLPRQYQSKADPMMGLVTAILGMYIVVELRIAG